MKTLLGATAALGLLAGASSAHAARDYVWAAGSAAKAGDATTDRASRTATEDPAIKSRWFDMTSSFEVVAPITRGDIPRTTPLEDEHPPFAPSWRFRPLTF